MARYIGETEANSVLVPCTAPTSTNQVLQVSPSSTAVGQWGKVLDAHIDPTAAISGAKMSTAFALPGTLSVPSPSCITPTTPSSRLPMALVFDQATTNFIVNPSFENDINHWAAVGSATLSRITTDSWIGASCMQISVPSGAGDNGAKHDTIVAGVGDQWSFSAYLKPSSSGLNCRLRMEYLNSINSVLTTTTTPDTAPFGGLEYSNNGFARVEVGATAPTNTAYVRVTVLNGSTNQGAYTIEVDACQCEKSATFSTSYCDGSLGPGYSWTGTANASSSTRSAGLHVLRGQSTFGRPVVFDIDGNIRTDWGIDIGVDGSDTVIMQMEVGGQGGISMVGNQANIDLSLEPKGSGRVLAGPPTTGQLQLAGAGTAFPSSPTANDVFFRTDRKILYYWDGTAGQWLTVNEYTMTGPNYATLGSVVSVSEGVQLTCPACSASGKVYLTSMAVSTYVYSGNSGNTSTSYWTIYLESSTNANIASVNTSADGAAPTGWKVHTASAINTIWSSSNGDGYLEVVATKSGTTGTPGNLAMGATICYRLVG